LKAKAQSRSSKNSPWRTTRIPQRELRRRGVVSDSLYPKYAGGRPRTFTLPERREIKKIAKSKPVEHGLPFSAWSLSKLADFLVADGVIDDISHEGLRVLLRDEGVSFQRIKTWKSSKDPDYEAKKARVEHLYAIADGEVVPDDGEPVAGAIGTPTTPGYVRSSSGRTLPDAALDTKCVRLSGGYRAGL
jgi:transposase